MKISNNYIVIKIFKIECYFVYSFISKNIYLIISFIVVFIFIYHVKNFRIKFPKFVTPLKTDQFNGTKIMSESRGARNRLNGKGLYAFTHYRNEYPNGHVWMNLNLHNSEENEAVPVKPITKFTEDFYKTYFVNQ